MICIKFGGWFQCRMPTGSDPADELRGVSGITKALAREPDLDRIIRFQPEGGFYRSHTDNQKVGVLVTEYYENNKKVEGHSLIGAQVNLLEAPIFKGENGIVARAGFEPIVPFVFQITNGTTLITRHCAAIKEFMEFPYPGLQPRAFYHAPGRIGEATGIFDIRKHLNQRIEHLENDLKTCTDQVIISNINRRIKFLKTDLAPFWFYLLVPFIIHLGGPLEIIDCDMHLLDKLDRTLKWDVDFWMGGWDPDASCGYVEGFLTIPIKS